VVVSLAMTKQQTVFDDAIRAVLSPPSSSKKSKKKACMLL